MNHTRAALLLFFAFFFTGLTGCRSVVRVGDFPLVSEFQILQSVSIEADTVDNGGHEVVAPVDLPKRTDD